MHRVPFPVISILSLSLVVHSLCLSGRMTLSQKKQQKEKLVLMLRLHRDKTLHNYLVILFMLMFLLIKRLDCAFMTRVRRIIFTLKSGVVSHMRIVHQL